MEQYIKALREREDVSEEILLELEERFKEVEEVIDIPNEPTEIEILRAEKELLARSVYDLTSIVEMILLGGIEE